MKPRDCKSTADYEKDGWLKRSVVTEPRLGELVELYEELGLEVLLVPLLELKEPHSDCESCTSCIEADDDPGRYKVIFTRER